MRKHLFLGLFLPFILVLTAIGTGFAVFFFGENQTKNNMDELVVVDNKVDSSFGTLFLAYGYEDNENFIDYNISGGDNHFDPFAYITQTTIDFPSLSELSLFSRIRNPRMRPMDTIPVSSILSIMRLRYPKFSLIISDFSILLSVMNLLEQ